jgi:hypothetical protein
MRIAATAACILVLMAGLGAGSALAQTAADQSDATGQAPAGQTAEPADDGAAMPDDALNPDAQDIAQVGDDADASPGRFIPTEQLSQDLGASFPVDI